MLFSTKGSSSIFPSTPADFNTRAACSFGDENTYLLRYRRRQMPSTRTQSTVAAYIQINPTLQIHICSAETRLISVRKLAEISAAANPTTSGREQEKHTQ